MAKQKTLSKCNCSCDGCCCKTPGHDVIGATNDGSSVHANGEIEKPRPFQLACEWDRNKTQQFSDDGTNTFFW